MTLWQGLDSVDQFVTNAESAATRAETAAATFDVDAMTVSGKAADAKACTMDNTRRTERSCYQSSLSARLWKARPSLSAQRAIFYIRNIGASGPLIPETVMHKRK